MSEALKQLRQLLIEGQRRSMQGSYERRLAAKDSIPLLRDARAGLKQYTSEHEDDGEGWRLLSQAEECLLHYAPARECLERAIARSGRAEKRDLKRLANLKAYETKWSTLIVSPAQLAELGRFLEAKLGVQECDHLLSLTEEWLRDKKIKNPAGVMNALRCFGGICDCEVLANVV